MNGVAAPMQLLPCVPSTGAFSVTDQPISAAGTTGPDPTVGRMLALVLIAHFLWNFLVPAHDYQLRTEQVMTMAFYFGMVVGLFAFRRVIPAPPFSIALAAGIALFRVPPHRGRLVDGPLCLFAAAAMNESRVASPDKRERRPGCSEPLTECRCAQAGFTSIRHADPRIPGKVPRRFESNPQYSPQLPAPCSYGFSARFAAGISVLRR